MIIEKKPYIMSTMTWDEAYSLWSLLDQVDDNNDHDIMPSVRIFKRKLREALGDNPQTGEHFEDLSKTAS